MPEFQILDEKRYPIKPRSVDKKADILSYYRWEHRVTLGYNAREFMVFVDTLLNKVYIEELVGGNLEVVKDDSLHTALANFSAENEFLNLFPPLIKPGSKALL